MNYKFVFCYECNESSKSDQRYVSYLKKKYFKKSDVPIVPVYLGSKSSYNKKSVVNNINKEIKVFKKQDPECTVVVIYFIDLDGTGNRMSEKNMQLNENIKDYCAENGYELVVFLKDIEDVLKVVKTGKKVEDSIEYIKLVNPPTLDKDKLSKETPQKKGESNILFILGKYFEAL